MAIDKTILDFSELLDNLDDDAMYLLRGTGTSRDRWQTRLNFLQDILQIGIVVWTSTRSYLADDSYVNLNGDVYQAIQGDQVAGPTENINKSPDANPLWWRLVIPKPVVPAWDFEADVDYEVPGFIVDRYGTHYASTGKLLNENIDPDDPQNDDYWIASPGWDILKRWSNQADPLPGGMHPTTDFSNALYQQNIKIDTIKRGIKTYDVYQICLDSTQVSGDTTLEDDILAVGTAKEYLRIDEYFPENIGIKDCIDMRGRSTRAMTAGGGVAATLAEVQEDQMQGHKTDFSMAAHTNVGTFINLQSQFVFANTSNGVVMTTQPTGAIITDGVNGTPRTGLETRVKALVRGVDYIIVIIEQ